MDDKWNINGWQIWQVDGKWKTMDGKYGNWMANGRQWMTNG